MTVIGWGDIQEGDTLRVTIKQGDLKITREGVAQQKVARYAKVWLTPEGLTLLAETPVTSKTLSIELIDRPKPELPTKTASVILVIESDGYRHNPPIGMVLDNSDEWCGVDSDGVFLTKRSRDITEWVEAQIMPLQTIVKVS